MIRKIQSSNKVVNFFNMITDRMVEYLEGVLYREGWFDLGKSNVILGKIDDLRKDNIKVPFVEKDNIKLPF